MRQEMTEINGLSKAKRISWFGPQNVISWTYMRMLREHHDTRKVYDVNPYIEVYQFRENLYGLLHLNCDGAGDVWMYLIVGPEKCLLIDTGYGLGDLKGLVEELAPGKDLIVVNTHDHFDHAFGNCRFEKVWCHENLVPLLKEQNEHMWDYLFNKQTGENIWLEFDRKDLPVLKPYEIIGVPDGYVFDLGEGYEVELISADGHGGPGAAMYLDKHNRILFPGDNMCSDVSGCGSISYPLEECSLYKFRGNLHRVVDRLDEIDRVFPQHFMNDLENRVLVDMLNALNTILEDPEHNYDNRIETKFASNPDIPPRVRYTKYINGFSVIAYSIEKENKPTVPAAIAALTK